MKAKKGGVKSKTVNVNGPALFKMTAKKPEMDMKPPPINNRSTSGAPKVKPAAQSARAARLAKVRL